VHTLGRHGIGYDQPITITQRQPGAAIEGALRQTLAPIQQIFTDTHGYSAWAMGLAKHVGYDLCPRLKGFPDRRLHVPRGNRIRIPESLKDVVLADISIEHIENGWAEFSAVCDAVAAGRISAVLACERFGSASRGERAYKAGHAYGLLLRTLHLCDTLTLEEFRRETLRALNHNERTHSLQRQIRRDGASSRRGRRAEELIAQSGALALVTNLVMAWNTHQMQATLDCWRAEGRQIDLRILHPSRRWASRASILAAFWSSLSSGIGRDCCRRARHRRLRWSRKKATDYPLRLLRLMGSSGIHTALRTN
jgi:TnpA family transposase